MQSKKPIAFAEPTNIDDDNDYSTEGFSKEIDISHDVISVVIQGEQSSATVTNALAAGFPDNAATRKRLAELCEVYSEAWVELAIERCVKYGAHTLAYLETILEEWKTAGKPLKGKKPGGNKPSGWVNPALMYEQREYTEVDFHRKPDWLVDALDEEARAADEASV